MKRMKISRMIAMVKDIETCMAAFTANPTEQNLRELQKARTRVADPAMLLPILERAQQLDDMFAQAAKTLKGKSHEEKHRWASVSPSKLATTTRNATGGNSNVWLRHDFAPVVRGAGTGWVARQSQQHGRFGCEKML